MYDNAACDGCGKIMGVEEADRANHASEFIWFCDDCRGYPIKEYSRVERLKKWHAWRRLGDYAIEKESWKYAIRFYKITGDWEVVFDMCFPFIHYSDIALPF